MKETAVTIPLIACLAVLLPFQIRAQNAEANEELLRVSIDCRTRFCDYDYFRRNVNFVAHVRNRQDADVHVLITAQETGSGGELFRLQFIGRGGYEDISYELSEASPPNASEDDVREDLVQAIKRGLLPYVSRTPLADLIDVTYTEARVDDVADTADDPWNYWVFRLSAGGFFRGEQRTQFSNVRGSADAERITEEWKIEAEVYGRRSSSIFEIDSTTTVTNLQYSYGTDALLARSLTDHWSIGATGGVGSSTFLNRDLTARATPAVEYNFFPYSESSEHQLLFLYEVGVYHYNYNERTIFERLAETRLQEALSITLEITQPWGSIETQLRGSHYFFDLSKNRVALFGDLEINLFRGLALNLFGRIASVRDQLYLSQENLDPEDILLQRRQLATNYEYFASVGLSYTFGSIYSSVVNPRFD